MPPYAVNPLLSGLIYCAHCGGKMHGTATTRKKNGKTYTYAKYIYSTYVMKGRSCGCGCHSVDQGRLMKLLLGKLQEWILPGGHRDTLRAAIVERLKARQTVDPVEVEQLRSQVAALDLEIEHGIKRLLRAPDDIADLLGAELSNKRREQDRQAEELAVMDRPKSQDVEAEADRLVDRVWQLTDDLHIQAQPARLREVVRVFVDRIDL